MLKLPLWGQPRRLSLRSCCGLLMLAAGAASAAPPALLDRTILSFRTTSLERVSITPAEAGPFAYRVCVGDRCYQENEGIASALIAVQLLLSAPEEVIAGELAPTLPGSAALPPETTLSLDADSRDQYAAAKAAVLKTYASQLDAGAKLQRVRVRFPGAESDYIFWLERFGPAVDDFRLDGPRFLSPAPSAEVKTLFFGPSFPKPLPGADARAALEAVLEQEPAGARKPAVSADWGALFGNPHPVDEVLRLHAARMPGSFALASTLAKHCNFANLVSQADPADAGLMDDPMAHAAGQPFHAQRLQARDKLRSRCVGMRQHKAVHQALPDDADARDWESVQRYELSFVESGVRLMAQELARQGSLHLLTLRAPVWDGRILNQALYSSAFGLAALLATAAPQGAAEDIRLLASCVQYSQCADDYTEYWLMGRALDAAKRRQVEALAQEMVAAMRAGEYEKFLR